MPSRKRKAAVKAGFRSGFEQTVAAKLTGCNYEPDKIHYTEEHHYTPDFIPKTDDKILIEVKGRFRTRAEASKYIWFLKSNPEYEIVFIFMAPTCAMPHAKKRKKCGTRMTHAEWAEKNGFKWYTLKDVPKEWCAG